MRASLLPLFTGLLLSGCAIADPQYCARDDGNGNTEICYDITGIEQSFFGVGLQASLGILCGITGATPAAGTCPDAGKVGGCQGDEQEKYFYVEWTNEGTLEELSCGSDEVKLAPNGEPASGSADTDADTDA